MSRYSYTINREGLQREPLHYYRRDELELMTTYQLREICRQERLINGLHAPLDKDELIRQIMRFRGREDRLFITKQVEGGWERLERLLASARLSTAMAASQGCAKITSYEGLAIEYFDRFSIGYAPELADTNALLVSGGELCAIFNIRAYGGAPDRLFITQAAELDCRESAIRDYTLYCMDHTQSDLLYQLYMNETAVSPEHLRFLTYPVLNFEVRPLLESRMPLAIDFGSSNTTAGVYLDSAYFEELKGDPITQVLRRDQINYVTYLDVEHDHEETPIFPTVAAVTGIEDGQVRYAFGHGANRLFHMSYMDEGFCVFYDLKRWVGDTDRVEELVDRQGHRSFTPRKEIIKAYLEHVIGCARQRFKCNFRALHISAPVKQKPLFIKLFQEIFPHYRLESEHMLDEGVAVLYNTISELIEARKYQNKREYRALIIDCGGGTTDLSSCRFRITDSRVAYQIQIATAYENGNTDFGGNNLTYRVMQLLKLSLARQLGRDDLPDPALLICGFDVDVFRMVDRDGPAAVYGPLDEAYGRAEDVLPTRFRDYEHSSRTDYYSVKNNFYFLFETAERIKKAFYTHTDLLRLAVSSLPVSEAATQCLRVDRWKLSVRQGGQFRLLKDIPNAYLNSHELRLLLRADIYGIIRQFMDGPYGNGELREYSILRLTGQSCKIDLFREALKEFIPGKVITSSRRDSGEQDYGLKLVCLNGAIKYLKDHKFGYADVSITQEQAAFPYMITAFTHTNEEKTLIHSLNRGKTRGYISRNMTDLSLKIYLKDLDGCQRYTYTCICDPAHFQNRQPEAIAAQYAGQIRQDDLDDIVDRELKFFVLGDADRWGFTVVPVLRNNGQLQLGPEQFFRFETEGWVTNFFDGTK